MTPIRKIQAVAAAAVVVLAAAPLAAQNLDNVQIKTVPVTDGVYMLTGQGGNIGLSIGKDGAFLIDDQYAPLTEKIVNAVTALTDEPIRFLVNTHWHGDHTGGNENMGTSGVIIVAHENVRERMSTTQFIEAFQMTATASPEAALPVITFTDALTFHYNDDVLHVFHVEHAHTDGDAIIHFREANVFHMGDTFFNGMYPFIDVSSGGTIDGMIEAADTVLKLTNRKTKIIPGHGPLGTVKDLRKYRDMLELVRERIRPMMLAGKYRDAVIAAKPTRDLDKKWGRGFMKPDQWVGIVFDGMRNTVKHPRPDRVPVPGG